MTGIRILMSACLVAAFISPVIAGSPDNPGAGGQFVKDFAHQEGPLGQTVSDYARNVGPPGEIVQQQKRWDGGSPNPDKDNGGGNDND